MTFEELLKHYQTLITENCKLKDEIVHLKAKLDALEHQVTITECSDFAVENILHQTILPLELFRHESEDQALPPKINNQSDPEEKVKLFMSYFKGRDDEIKRRGRQDIHRPV